MSNLDKPAMPHFGHTGWSGPGLTIRQHAAITLRVPMSGDPEIDAMIREARRLDMATAAMQGMLADPEFDPKVSEVAVRSYNVADALLAASEPKKSLRDMTEADFDAAHGFVEPKKAEHEQEIMPMLPVSDAIAHSHMRDVIHLARMNFSADAPQADRDAFNSAARFVESALDRGIKIEPTLPQPDAEGWIEWNGGECPVAPDQVVRARLRNGGEHVGAAGYFLWAHLDDDDIIAYRVVK